LVAAVPREFLPEAYGFRIRLEIPSNDLRWILLGVYNSMKEIKSHYPISP
jgi:hypothetical protein